MSHSNGVFLSSLFAAVFSQTHWDARDVTGEDGRVVARAQEMRHGTSADLHGARRVRGRRLWGPTVSGTRPDIIFKLDICVHVSTLSLYKLSCSSYHACGIVRIGFWGGAVCQ